MEKDQLDSLATVAVGSEKIPPPPPHSFYAPSDVYSSSESPPAYTRPGSKSSAVQIAKIIAVTLIPISLIIGSFVLATAWFQAHSATTSDFITVLKSQIDAQQQQNELFKHLQPEALVQEPIEARDNFQSIAESPKHNPINDLNISKLKDDKSTKVKAEIDNNNINDDDEEDKADKKGETNDSTEDYDDLGELSPVHIKLPVQLDIEELANNLLQQTQGFVSCVVERKKSNDSPNGDAELNNNVQRILKVINNERVTILCESKEPPRSESEQDMRPPLIIPLSNFQIPMQQAEQNYHRYRINQHQYPMNQLVQRPSYGANNFESLMVPSELRNIQQIVEMGLQRMGFPSIHNQQMEIHQIPIELRPVSIEMIKGMKPPMDYEPQQHQQQRQMPEQQQPEIQQIYAQDSQIPDGMMPPPPPPPAPQQSMLPSAPSSLQDMPHNIPQMIIQQKIEEKPIQQQENPEKRPLLSPPLFQNLPFEIKRIMQQVPIKDIIQHITGQVHHVPVPDGARREPVQEFKAFPMEPLIHLNGVRNILERGNVENHVQNTYENQQEDMKPAAKMPTDEDDKEESTNEQEQDDDSVTEIDAKNLVPPEIKNIIHRFIERPFEMSFRRFLRPLRPFNTMEVPIGSSMAVNSESIPQNPENIHLQKQQQQLPEQTGEMQQVQPNQQTPEPSPNHPEFPEQENAENRPHYVQPRSVV